MSAIVSYARYAQDLTVLTGRAVSRGTQQRLVQRQSCELPSADVAVEAISLDGGKVRLRIPKGELCRWQDDKAVNLHRHACEAFFQAHEKLLDWVNQQSLSTPVICLGDGHDGIGIYSGTLLKQTNDKKFETGCTCWRTSTK